MLQTNDSSSFAHRLAIVLRNSQFTVSAACLFSGLIFQANEIQAQQNIRVHYADETAALPEPGPFQGGTDAIYVGWETTQTEVRMAQLTDLPQVQPSQILSNDLPAPTSSAADDASNAPQQTAPKSKKDGMLSTAEMIGPLRDSQTLFSEIKIKEDYRYLAQTIPDGPRITEQDFSWSPDLTTWASPVFHHRPLYFEQPNLERYGNGCNRYLQPALSSAHFFTSVPLMPYKMLRDPPWQDTYTLGERRPGNLVPMQTGTLINE